MIEVIHMMTEPNIVKYTCDRCGMDCSPKSVWMERHLYRYGGDDLCLQCLLYELELADVIDEVKE